MNKKFSFNGDVFEIRQISSNNCHAVKVFLDNKQVSPEYSITFEVGNDYFNEHKKSMLEELIKVAEQDIRNGIYFNPA